jgi:hypothetical protein
MAAIAALVVGVGLVAPAADAKVKKGRTFKSTVILRGQTGERISVKPLRVLDPVEVGEFNTPPEGFRYVGVEVRLRNLGQRAYTDSPGNGSRIVTGAGASLKNEILVDSNCNTDGSLTVPRGRSKVTCIAFQVPVGATPRFFKHTLNSGFGPDTGRWRLPG